MSAKVDDFFANTTILITGGTGFIGKVLIEKLLRSQKDINKLYILIRSKKGRNAEDRAKTDIFDQPIFQQLKQSNPDYMDKVVIMHGDILESRLHLSEKNLEKIFDEVNIVFNCAASVHLSANLKHSTKYNLKSVVEMLELCRRMTKLKSVVLVSTAYSNCNRKIVEEKIYDAPISSELAMSLCKELEDDVLVEVTKLISKGLPNAYSFSKTLMENYLRCYNDLPIVLFRPGAVTASYQEPLPGWVDNISGQAGAYYAVAMGVLRVTNFDGSKASNWVPVDYCTNALICSAWHGVKNRMLNNNNEIVVYNYTCESFKKPLNTYCDSLNSKMIKLQSSIWKPMIIHTSNNCLYYILLIILQYIPAYVIDIGSALTGNKMRINEIYKKRILPLLNSIKFCASNEWIFDEKNTYKMWEALDESEKERYNFNPRNIDFDTYMTNFIIGTKLYLAKEKMENNEMALQKHKILHFVHYALMSLVVVAVVWILYSFFVNVMKF